MFQAILHGKVRNNLVGVDVGVEWRKLFRETEDFLTAAVFSRLTYLPSDTVWSIIRGAACVTVPIELPKDAGRLTAREFWPRWELASPEHETGTTEPDVLLEFERLSLLVEAKLRDGYQHRPIQWAAELEACIRREEVDPSIPVWFLAIGGMGEEPTRVDACRMWEETTRLLHGTYPDPNPPVHLAVCSWRHLLASLVEATKHTDSLSDTGMRYVIEDLVEILRFHGVRYSHWLEELLRPPLLGLRTFRNDSSVTLGAWVGRTRTVDVTERPCWFIPTDLRGIRDQSILTLGRNFHAG